VTELTLEMPSAAAGQSPATGALDDAIRTLRDHRDEWATLPVRRKMDLLTQARAALGIHAQSWVNASVEGKQLDAQSPWVGEEWVTGPWALAAGMNGYLESLRSLAEGRPPKLPAVSTRPDGQVVVKVFPPNVFSWILFNGITAHVWMQPEVTESNLSENLAVFYRQPHPGGKVALVLGAGNINSIAPLDVLYKLYVEGQVVLLKMNPVNDYLAPVLERVLSPFVSAGFLRIVTGGADVGAYLTQHAGTDEIHITGSARTHDAIVYGPGAEGAARKSQDERITSKRVSSELGGVGPTIVVPGPWTDDDIQFQAEHIVTMKLHNAGSNCVASQVLVLPAEWDRSADLLDAVRRLLRDLPPRVAYYPGTAERLRQVLAIHPDAEQFGSGDSLRILIANLDPAATEELCFREEVFGPGFAQTSLPGATAADYLANAVRFANEKLNGTLGATLLVHPSTQRELAASLDQAIANLRYGSIGINVWNAAAFLLTEAAWGAHPGHEPGDIQSGIGVAHNTFMLEKTQKTVVRGSFYPFPRSIRHGDFSLLPHPPWFVTNRMAPVTARRITYFAVDPGWRHIPGILAAALRGGW
jgi:aldehyde dehydrogenase (NAD(P)+)